MEVLSVLIKRAAFLNLIPGLRPSSEAFEINHLQFSDDLIVFVDDNCAQKVLDENAGNSWNFDFCRNFREAEIEDIAHLLNFLDTFNRGEGQDHRLWQNGTKTFSVAECYKSLEDDGLLVFPYKSVWNPKIPHKMIFFVWSLCYNAAPIMDLLRNSYNVNGCVLCKKSAESNQHFFLHCDTTREIWFYFLSA
ncbi:uncharacterized protein LOC113271938 [Papaver somniferum]|uniref:uncharacterized protein LOC113271938 n=1 Tax=Papaver somniferum TaxID=3469 RepID=UPI000E703325|nr:uncharacterized protein LOC113271938 [Papaver somniferum]